MDLHSETKMEESGDKLVGVKDAAGDVISLLTRNASIKLKKISISGMPGLGKTTLAKSVYSHPSITSHFDARAWCFASHSYEIKALLSEILSQIIGKTGKNGEDDIDQQLYQSLKGKRYLVVIDDVWDNKLWDKLRRILPDDRKGSRILFTTRIQSVASEADGIHRLRFLKEEESSELLLSKVFDGQPYPSDLLVIVQDIARICRGLPLAVVLIAGILKRSTMSLDSWRQVAAETEKGFVTGPGERNIATILELSYNHLPDFLKSCFLFFGSLPKVKMIPVSNLIRLWISEGLIQKYAIGSPLKSSVQMAKEYVNELVDRSLVMVARTSSDGGIKACRIHDVLLDFCCATLRKEKFFYKEKTPEGGILFLRGNLESGLHSCLYHYGSDAAKRSTQTSMPCLPTSASSHNQSHSRSKRTLSSATERRSLSSTRRMPTPNFRAPSMETFSLSNSRQIPLPKPFNPSMEKISLSGLRRMAPPKSRTPTKEAISLPSPRRMPPPKSLILAMETISLSSPGRMLSPKSCAPDSSTRISLSSTRTTTPPKPLTPTPEKISSSSSPLWISRKTLKKARTCYPKVHPSRKLDYGLFLQYKLLTILDLGNVRFGSGAYPADLVNISKLALLRYLAIRPHNNELPTEIGYLQNLETLVVRGVIGIIKLPESVWSLNCLRHLLSDHGFFSVQHCSKQFFDGFSHKDNIESISSLILRRGNNVDKFMLRKMTGIRKLGCRFLANSSEESSVNTIFPEMGYLTELRSVKIFFTGKVLVECPCKFSFPLNLTKLSMRNFRIPWDQISAIGKLLPYLEVLKLLNKAFQGKKWSVGAEEFPNLKFLKLGYLNVEEWEVSDHDHLPSLERLVIIHCKDLMKLPSSIGETSSLKLIEMKQCSSSAMASARQILKAQRDYGNHDLVVNLIASNANVFHFF